MVGFGVSTEAGEDKVDHGQVCLGLLGVAIQHNWLVAVAESTQVVVALPAVSPYNGTFHHALFDELGEVFGPTTRYEAQPNSPSVCNTLPGFALRLAAPPLGGESPFSARTHLDSPDNSRLVVDATAFSTGAPTHERLIDLDRILPADAVTVGSHHPGAQLVEDLKRGLVPANAELSLELEGGLPRRLRRHEVRAPKPCRQGRVAGLHDSTCRQRYVGLAASTPEDDGRTPREAVWLADGPTFCAPKPVRPSQPFQVGSTGCVVWKDPLEFWKRGREAALIHPRTLPRLTPFGKQPDR